MEPITTLLTIATGLLVRLLIPILGTLLLIYILRQLDAHWQAEAERMPTPSEKVECWKIKGCPAEQYKNCVAAASPLPCWQTHRQPNGYLQEKCISCEVFINAPIPTLKIEPRRM
jgi:hypothetical protein